MMNRLVMVSFTYNEKYYGIITSKKILLNYDNQK
jgi:hypothetical protein